MVSRDAQKTLWVSLTTCATTAGLQDYWQRMALAIKGRQMTNFALQKFSLPPAGTLQNSAAFVVVSKVAGSGTWQLAESRADAGRRHEVVRGPRPSRTANFVSR